jgi:hypothetical protein
MQIRSSMVKGILICCVVIWLLVQFFLFPNRIVRTKAQMLKARSDQQILRTILEEEAGKAGGLAEISNDFIIKAVFASNRIQFSFKTNLLGEVIDPWGTPYQINFLGKTNFVVRSAGKNQKFGDKDDVTNLVP